jgi:hypothetical protein
MAPLIHIHTGSNTIEVGAAIVGEGLKIDPSAVLLLRLDLLEGVAVEARHDGRDEPARVALPGKPKSTRSRPFSPFAAALPTGRSDRKGATAALGASRTTSGRLIVT